MTNGLQTNASERASEFISPALWRSFASARSFAELSEGWVDLCRANLALSLGIDPVEIVVAFNSQENGKRHFHIASYRGPDSKPGSALTQVVQRSLVVRGGVLNTNSDLHKGFVANVIAVGDDLKGAVGIVLSTTDMSKLNLAMRCLQWNAIWLSNFWRSSQTDETNETLVLKYGQRAIFAIQACSDLVAAATACATVLADDLAASRVTIGRFHNNRMAILGSSHTTHVTSRSDKTHLIVDAMREAMLANEPVSCSGDGSSSKTWPQSHAALSEDRETAWVGTWPVAMPDESDGYILIQIECASDQAARISGFIGAITGALAPSFSLVIAASRPPLFRLIRQYKNAIASLTGAGHMRLKCVGIAIALLLITSLIIRIPYNVAADAEVEGLVQRAVTAPFDGFIANGPVRAGDVVDRGDILGRMETRELDLHRYELQSAIVESQRKIEAARGEGNLSEARILHSRMQQSISELEMLQNRLDRTELRAPFGGFVIEGDLSQKIGSPVKEGEVLFTLSPLDQYRLNLGVNEKEIRHIAVGQKGLLLLHARPNVVNEITIKRISPISQAKDGENLFQVEAVLDRATTDFQPGMRGIAKVETEPESIFWIYTHPLWDWLRVKIWGILP